MTARTMRAQRLDTATLTYEVTDVPVSTPGPGEVLIEVAFCGICHSDLSLLDGTFPTSSAGRSATGSSPPRDVRAGSATTV